MRLDHQQIVLPNIPRLYDPSPTVRSGSDADTHFTAFLMEAQHAPREVTTLARPSGQASGDVTAHGPRGGELFVELTVLHDHEQLVGVLQDLHVGQRIAVHQEDIGEEVGFDLA
jgi:hypothetical protein